MALRLLREMPEPVAADPLAEFGTASRKRSELRGQRKHLRAEIQRLERELYEGAEARNEARAEELVEAVMAGRPIPVLTSLADQIKATRDRLEAVELACGRFDETVYQPAHRRAKRHASRLVRDQHREIVRQQIECLTKLSDLIVAEETLRGDLARQNLLDEQTLPACSFPNVGNLRTYGAPANTWLKWLAGRGFGFENED